MAIIKIKNAAIDLDAAEIPNLPATKITSGTFDNARISLDAAEIPNLDTAKITTGTLADARLPANALNSNIDLTNLSASNLTSGTVATARLGSGTANSSTFLRGDGSFATPAGGENTPAFEVSLSGNQSIDNSETSTKVTFDTETIDSDGKFASNKFTPTVAGTYFISLTVAIENGTTGETDLVIALLKKNGSTVTASDARVDFRGNRARGASVTVNHVIALDSDDYVEGFAAHAAGGGTANIMQFGTRMGGFKLIT